MLSLDTLIFHTLGTGYFPSNYADGDSSITPAQIDKASFLRAACIRSAKAEIASLSTPSGKFLVDNSNVLLELPYPYRRGYYTTNNETDIETFYLSRGYFRIQYDSEGNDISEYIQIRKSRPNSVGASSRYLKNPNEMDIIFGVEQTKALPLQSYARARAVKDTAKTLHITKSGRSSKIDPNTWF